MQLSVAFLIYLAIVLPLAYLFPQRGKSCLLLVASLVFYAFAGWRAMAILTLLGTWTYVLGRLLGMSRQRQERVLAARREDGTWDKATRRAFARHMTRRRSWLLALGVGVDIAALLAFKWGIPARLGMSGWLLPLGLSFVTLSLVGYLFDVANGQLVCEKNIFHFALFTFYFPQMWQGPINRYAELAPYLREPLQVRFRAAVAALLRMLWGTVKKVVIADTAAVAVKTVVDSAQAYGGTGIWMLVLLYSLQIYADFTGGMDIALGLSSFLGVPLFENFDCPFGAASVADYWRRWHRSLGRFFTDRVFYPLSVSRPSQALSIWARRVLGEAVGKRLPLYLSVLVTWFLTGLWHGAAWNFILWGLCNGVFILISQELRPVRRVLSQTMPRLATSRPLAYLCTLGTLGTVGLFRTLDLHGNAALTLRLWADALRPARVSALFDGATWQTLGLDGEQWLLLLAGSVLMWWVGAHTPRLGTGGTPLRERVAARPYLAAMLAALGISAVLIFGNYGMGYDATQFIYGQF